VDVSQSQFYHIIILGSGPPLAGLFVQKNGNVIGGHACNVGGKKAAQARD
jgi:hypothetical protein